MSSSVDGQTEGPTVDADVVIVNWNSGAGLAAVVESLAAQVDVVLRIIVVDNGSVDESVALAKATGIEFVLHQTGANLGYAGGNNAGFALCPMTRPVIVSNPDVTWADRSAVRSLLNALAAATGSAALAPLIVEDDAGTIEYLDSAIDLDRACAIHTTTHVPKLPSDLLDVVSISWLDGAALAFRPEALHQVGGFDERYFLLFEDVEWAMRARHAGWDLGLLTTARVRHRRSSSLATTGLGAFYYWRNLYLLCREHARRPMMWRLHYALAAARFTIRHRDLSALRGAVASAQRRFGRKTDTI